MSKNNNNPSFLQKTFQHLKTIHEHRSIVRKFCFQCGLYKQGLTHDLSKYSFAELLPSIHYYQGYRSPYTKEKELHGYSLGWLHHKGCNKHHWEYWWDKIDGKWQAIKMPQNYVVESVCDRIAACKVYQKEQYTQSSALNYYLNSHDEQNLHPQTANLFERILRYIEKYGEDSTFKRIKDLLQQKKDLYEVF